MNLTKGLNFIFPNLKSVKQKMKILQWNFGDKSQGGNFKRKISWMLSGMEIQRWAQNENGKRNTN